MNNKFNGFSWAGTRTNKFKETKAFFKEFFGLEPAHEKDGFVAFNLKNGQTFEVFSDTFSSHKHFSTGPVIGFDVDDIDNTRKEMEKMGIEFIGPTGGDIQKSRWAHFRGPDGNIYELKWRAR